MSAEQERIAHQLLTSTGKKGKEYWGGREKRSLDILISSGMIPPALPIVALCGLAVWLGDGANPYINITTQPDDGLTYDKWKIRTMIPNARNLEVKLCEGKTVNDIKDKDPRVTRIGRILRRSSFDELPQLGQVLGGKWSMVGPRLLSGADYSYMNERLDRETVSEYMNMLRSGIKPGVTGLYGVMGRARLQIHDILGLDKIYANEASFKGDLRIIGLTAVEVLRRTGAK